MQVSLYGLKDDLEESLLNEDYEKAELISELIRLKEMLDEKKEKYDNELSEDNVG